MKALGIKVRSDEIRLKGSSSKLSDWQRSEDPSMIDSTKIYPGGIELSAHGSRHNRGAADPIDYQHVVVGLNKSVSPTVAASGATPAAVDVAPDTGFSALFPIWIKVTLGSLATGETITVTITATYDDGTTNSISETLSASGSIDPSALIADGKVITKLSITAQSNKTTTTATCTVNVIGFQH